MHASACFEEPPAARHEQADQTAAAPPLSTQVLEGAQIYVDPAYPAPAMSDLLARTTRLLQVALDQQFQENEQAVSILNVRRRAGLLPLRQAPTSLGACHACAGALQPCLHRFPPLP